MPQPPPSFSTGTYSSSFAFQNRSSPFNWSSIKILNLPKIRLQCDIGELESVVEPITFSKFDHRELESTPLSDILTLIELSQLLLEYLLYSQKLLTHSHAQLTASHTQLSSQLHHQQLIQREKRQEWQKERKELKKEIEWREKTISIYQNGGKERRNQNYQQGKTSRSFVQGKHLPVDGENGEIFPCPECSASFLSSFYLSSHLVRRHSDHKKESDLMKETTAALIEAKTKLMSMEEERERRKEEREEERIKEKEREKREGTLDPSRTQAQFDFNNSKMISLEELKSWQSEITSLIEKRAAKMLETGRIEEKSSLLPRLAILEQSVQSLQTTITIEKEQQQNRSMFDSIKKEIEIIKQDLQLKKATQLEDRNETGGETKSIATVSINRAKEEQFREAAEEREIEIVSLEEERRRLRESQKVALTAALASKEEEVRLRQEILNHQEAEKNRLAEEENKRLSIVAHATPAYPVIPNLPFLLARYPHAPQLINKLQEEIEERVDTQVSNCGNARAPRENLENLKPKQMSIPLQQSESSVFPKQNLTPPASDQDDSNRNSGFSSPSISRSLSSSEKENFNLIFNSGEESRSQEESDHRVEDEYEDISKKKVSLIPAGAVYSRAGEWRLEERVPNNTVDFIELKNQLAEIEAEKLRLKQENDQLARSKENIQKKFQQEERKILQNQQQEKDPEEEKISNFEKEEKGRSRIIQENEQRNQSEKKDDRPLNSNSSSEAGPATSNPFNSNRSKNTGSATISTAAIHSDSSSSDSDSDSDLEIEINPTPALIKKENKNPSNPVNFVSAQQIVPIERSSEISDDSSDDDGDDDDDEEKQTVRKKEDTKISITKRSSFEEIAKKDFSFPPSHQKIMDSIDSEEEIDLSEDEEMTVKELIAKSKEPKFARSPPPSLNTRLIREDSPGAITTPVFTTHLASSPTSSPTAATLHAKNSIYADRTQSQKKESESRSVNDSNHENRNRNESEGRRGSIELSEEWDEEELEQEILAEIKKNGEKPSSKRSSISKNGGKEQPREKVGSYLTMNRRGGGKEETNTVSTPSLPSSNSEANLVEEITSIGHLSFPKTTDANRNDISNSSSDNTPNSSKSDNKSFNHSRIISDSSSTGAGTVRNSSMKGERKADLRTTATPAFERSWKVF